MWQKICSLSERIQRMLENPALERVYHQIRQEGNEDIVLHFNTAKFL